MTDLCLIPNLNLISVFFSFIPQKLSKLCFESRINDAHLYCKARYFSFAADILYGISIILKRVFLFSRRPYIISNNKWPVSKRLPSLILKAPTIHHLDDPRYILPQNQLIFLRFEDIN